MHKQILLYTAAVISFSSFQLAVAEPQLNADKPGIRDACYEETTRINHPTLKPSANVAAQVDPVLSARMEDLLVNPRRLSTSVVWI